jgi:hypothetical protein
VSLEGCVALWPNQGHSPTLPDRALLLLQVRPCLLAQAAWRGGCKALCTLHSCAAAGERNFGLPSLLFPRQHLLVGVESWSR